MAYNKNIYTKGTTTYKDLDMSLKAHPFTGDLRTKTDVDAIKQSLKNLLYTNFGERPFRPSMGGGIQHLLFEQMDQITMLELDEAIRRVISNWEPRVRIISLDINGLDDTNSLEITLAFSMVNFVDPQKISIILQRIR